MTHASVRHSRNEPAAQFKAKKLAVVKHLAVVGIAPPVQAIGFVAGENCLLRDESGLGIPPARTEGRNPLEVLGIWLLEKAAGVVMLPARIAVLDGEQPMPERA